MKYTSAEAGKLVKKLNDKASALIRMEGKTSTFLAAVGEDAESVRPAYDFTETQKELETLYAQIRTVKHAINVFNTTHELPGFEGLTIDQALVYIPQLSYRREILSSMAQHLPKERVGSSYSNSSIIDYEIANYDREEVQAVFEQVSETLSKMQLALDIINTRETMEIDVEVK